MDALTASDIDILLQQLETLTTALEHDGAEATFYRLILLGQEGATAKQAGWTLAQIHRCLRLAQRMVPLRAQMTTGGGRWTPLWDVLKLLESEAARLATLYGVLRPPSITVRRELQQTFRTAFRQATGKTYMKFGYNWTAQEDRMITRFWDDAMRTAFAQFQTTNTVEALDAVMACLPVWADRWHERWRQHTWREPTAHAALVMVTEYLRMCEACLASLTQMAQDAVATSVDLDPAQVAQDVAPQYATQVEGLRAQLSTLPLPKDTPKAQQAQVRKQKTQLNQELQALLKTQEAETTRRLRRHANARRKLDTLVKTLNGYPESVMQKVGKASLHGFSDMVWTHGYYQRGDADWRAAQREVRRFVRQLREAHAQPVAVAAR